MPTTQVKPSVIYSDDKITVVKTDDGYRLTKLAPSHLTVHAYNPDWRGLRLVEGLERVERYQVLCKIALVNERFQSRFDVQDSDGYEGVELYKFYSTDSCLPVLRDIAEQVPDLRLCDLNAIGVRFDIEHLLAAMIDAKDAIADAAENIPEEIEAQIPWALLDLGALVFNGTHFVEAV